MATACLPIDEIGEKGRQATQILEQENVRRIMPRLRIVPRLLRDINDSLSGERLGQLTAEDVAQIYPPLEALVKTLSKAASADFYIPWLLRPLLGSWRRTMETETERLQAIEETLAWAADRESREYLQSLVHQLDQRLNRTPA